MRGEKGFALVLTLVVTALMVAAAVELIRQVYVDTSLSRTFRDGQQASLLAESAAKGGITLLRMAISSQGNYTSLSDKWAAPFKQEDDTGRIEVTITEESGKINLNALIQANNTDINPDTLKILTGLGAQLQIPDSAWNALADWIDSDDTPRGSGGAESSYYRTLNPPYSARNGRMTTVNELSLVKGFTTDMVNRLTPFVTIYSPGGLIAQNVWVNVNTAPKEVLMALDPRITASMAQQVIEQRQLAPFKTTGELSRVNPLFNNIQGVQVMGAVFRITARGFVKDAARTVEAVYRMSDNTILSWQEY